VNKFEGFVTIKKKTNDVNAKSSQQSSQAVMEYNENRDNYALLSSSATKTATRVGLRSSKDNGSLGMVSTSSTSNYKAPVAADLSMESAVSTNVLDNSNYGAYESDIKDIDKRIMELEAYIEKNR
jgi:hypothetical protein